MKKFTVEYQDESGAIKQVRGRAVAMSDITDHWRSWSRANIGRRQEYRLVAVSGGWDS